MADVAARLAREILDENLIAARDGILVELHQVGCRAHGDPSAIFHSPRIRRLRRDAMDCALEAHLAELPHVTLEQIAGIAGAAELRDMRTRIGRADVDARMIEN